jgi:H+/Cl- antiporter ClcA
MLGRASATRSATGARAAARPVAAAQPPRSLHAPSALARRSRRPPDTSRRASRPPRTLAATPRGAPPAAAAGDAPPPGEEGGAAGELALIFVAVGVGLATGASFVAFNEAIHVLRDAVWGTEEFLTGRALLRTLTEAQLWPLVALPPIGGGLAVGALKLVVGGYADRAASSDDGTAERVRAAARPWARAAAAAVALGTGASLGPEGPIVDIGRSWAAGLGAALGGAPRRAALTSLLAAGAGAGVAAGFNAPIAGVFFAVETVLQREAFGGGADNSKDAPDGAGPARGDALASNGLTVAMVLLAAVVAASVVQAGLGSSPAFRVPEYRLESLGELPVFAAFGALCGAVSASFSYSTRVATDAFADIRAAAPVPAAAALLPAVGGLTTGVLALGYPEILYQGFDNINSVLASSGDYSAAPGLLLQILVVKIIATAICRGSGLQGGLYAPSIMMGAALGAAFGQVRGMGRRSALSIGII